MEVGFLQETKSILKSLVLSCPNGMTQDRLNRDYKEVVGTWIPFQKLGFSSLELFLKSISDTLVVTGYGRDARIGFVSNDKVKHINEMISHQKNTTRDRKTAVLHRSSQKSVEEKWQQSHNKNVHNIKTPAAVATTTFCTFNQQPPINSNLNNNYLYLYPQPNYLCQPNLIYQAPLCIGGPSVYHVPFDNAQKRYYLPPSKMNYNKQPEYKHPKEDENQKKLQEQSKSRVIEDKQNNKKNVSEETNKIATSVLPKSINRKGMLREPHSSKSVLTEKNSSKTTLNPRDTNGNNSKSVLDLQKNPVKDRVEIKYPRTVKLVDQENSLTHLLGEQDSSNSMLDHQNKSEKSLGEQNNTRNVMDEQKNTSTNRLDDKMNSTKVPTSIPDEIKYPNKNKKTATKTMETDVNVSSGKESSDAVVNRSALALAYGSKNASFNNSITKALADPFAQINSYDNDIDEAVPEFAANNLVFRVDFPENMVAFGKKIPNYVVPKELTKGSVVGVFISEIHSPFKFWFHIYKDNHELDILMNRIECFYRRLYDDDLVIPKTCLAIGQVCAALYNNMWHRAEILTNECKNKVKAYFVDYGTVSEIEIKNIKYLPTMFANTPMQAIRGSLSHIKPVSPLWPKRAIREFLSMVSEVLLYAQIVEVDEKEKTVYMVLCDTNNGEIVQVNKQLVDRGFAKLDSEWDENKIAKNGYRKRHPREIFPTFEMLETGEYPSLFELEQLLAQGIDYEKITEKIILSNLNNNLCDELVLREDYPTRKDTLSFNLLDTNPFKSDIISEIVSLKIFGD